MELLLYEELKSDNNRIARATGATIVNRVEDLKESDIGTKCGEFKVELIGDEYFTYLVKCENPQACTVLLRGAPKISLMKLKETYMMHGCHQKRHV